MREDITRTEAFRASEHWLRGQREIDVFERSQLDGETAIGIESLDADGMDVPAQRDLLFSWTPPGPRGQRTQLRDSTP